MDFFSKKICFCFPPQTSAKIIGLLNLVADLFLLVGITLQKYSRQEDDESKRTASLLYFFQFIFLIVSIMVAICVLIAVSKNHGRRLLLPWLIIKPFTGHVATGYMFYFALSDWINNDVATGMVFVVAGAGIFAIEVFCWLGVLSYYLKLSEVCKRNKVTPPTGRRATSKADQDVLIFNER